VLSAQFTIWQGCGLANNIVPLLSGRSFAYYGMLGRSSTNAGDAYI